MHFKGGDLAWNTTINRFSLTSCNSTDCLWNHPHTRGLQVCPAPWLPEVPAQTWPGLGSSHLKWLCVQFGVGTVCRGLDPFGPVTTVIFHSCLILWSYPVFIMLVKCYSKQLQENCSASVARNVTRTDTSVPSRCQQCKNMTVPIFLWYRRYQTYNLK